MFRKNCVFYPTTFIILPSQALWAAIGCTEIGQIGQPIGVTVRSHYCFESFENLLQRYVGEGWGAVDDEKKHNFPEHPVFKLLNFYLYIVGICKRILDFAEKGSRSSWTSNMYICIENQHCFQENFTVPCLSKSNSKFCHNC